MPNAGRVYVPHVQYVPRPRAVRRLRTLSTAQTRG
jgi:hypothetical protein